MIYRKAYRNLKEKFAENKWKNNVSLTVSNETNTKNLRIFWLKKKQIF